MVLTFTSIKGRLESRSFQRYLTEVFYWYLSIFLIILFILLTSLFIKLFSGFCDIDKDQKNSLWLDKWLKSSHYFFLYTQRTRAWILWTVLGVTHYFQNQHTLCRLYRFSKYTPKRIERVVKSFDNWTRGVRATRATERVRRLWFCSPARLPRAWLTC